MTFRNPDLLWLLLLAPLTALAFVWLARRRAAATQRFGNPSTLSRLVVGRASGLRATQAIVFVIGLSMLTLALAGPQYGSRTRWLRKRGIDIVIALDFSKSMLARDVRPSRIERAKAELVRFLDQLDGDRVGVVSFAGDTMEYPMTTDYASVGLFLRDMTPMDMPVGGTAIGRALIASQRLLERSHRENESPEERARKSMAVILLTDGEDHEGDPVEAARQLAAAGIQVYPVGIGSRSGEPIPVYTDDGTWTGYARDDEGDIVTTSFSAEAEGVLREVADITSGRFIRAEEGGVGMGELRQHLASLQQSEHQARQITVQEDRFALVLFPAFLLLMLEALLPEAWILRRRRRRESENDPRSAKETPSKETSK
ncbi:MAG: VWA domain-containing protein [Myxococcota bacterium]